MSSANLQVTIVSGVLRSDPPAPQTGTGPEAIELPVRRWLPRFGFVATFSIRAALGLWKAVRSSDVVHVSFARDMLPAFTAACCVLTRTPWVAQSHGMLTARTSHFHRALDIVVRPILRTAKTVIALTPNEARELKEWDSLAPPIRVIPNPLVANVAVPPRAKDVDALFIARIHDRKRPLDFIGAAKVANDNGWSEKYELVGPVQMDQSILTAALRAAPNATHSGAVRPESVPAQLARARVFVLTSSNEPWGNVLVMALAMGIPCVVTASSALAPALANAHAALVVPDGDRLAIATAVHRITSEPALSAVLSDAGRNFFNNQLSN